jgi:hypothetical protein
LINAKKVEVACPLQIHSYLVGLLEKEVLPSEMNCHIDQNFVRIPLPVGAKKDTHNHFTL